MKNVKTVGIIVAGVITGVILSTQIVKTIRNRKNKKQKTNKKGRK